jgi:hypothetical protein
MVLPSTWSAVSGPLRLTRRALRSGKAAPLVLRKPAALNRRTHERAILRLLRGGPRLDSCTRTGALALCVRRAGTRPLFGRRMRVPPDTPRGSTYAHHTRAGCMLPHGASFRNAFPLCPLARWLCGRIAWPSHQRAIHWGRAPWEARAWSTRGHVEHAGHVSHSAPVRSGRRSAPLPYVSCMPLIQHAALCWWDRPPAGRAYPGHAHPPRRQRHPCGRIPSYFGETPCVLWGDALRTLGRPPLVLWGDALRTLGRQNMLEPFDLAGLIVPGLVRRLYRRLPTHRRVYSTLVHGAGGSTR